MRFRGIRLRNAALLMLALSAGGIAASASGPQHAAAWTADPEEQFLLDVNIRQLRLGDGVRAYNTPEGTCVVLGDFLTTLDVPMRIDMAAKQASGWAFKESHRIAIDIARLNASYGDKSEPIAPGTVRETPEGWCVQAGALSRWFGIGVKPVTAGSVLLLQSETKLPVELAIERENRAKRIRPARFDLGSLPQVRLPYRMWRAPALDFVVNAGVTYRARDGVRVDRQSSVYAAGEIARLSYDAQFTTDRRGMPSTVRVRAFRSDPDGGLLGPAKATHFGVGDVDGFDSRLTGSISRGRGAVITNRPLTTQSNFDRSRFEGDLPAGWEAEIYRNTELLGFTKATPDQRYAFENVPLLYGDNEIRIVLYGPQGQIRTRVETINVGRESAPPGQTWYWAGFNQPGRDIVTLQKPPDASHVPKAQAAIAVEHGIDTRTSVAVLARTMLVDDTRLTFVEGTVRRSIGPALLEVGVARETRGGTAARAQLLGKFGPVNVNAEAIIANDFQLQGRVRESVRDLRLGLDAPLKIGRTVIPAHASLHYVDRVDGTKELEAAGRLSTSFNSFNLSTVARYRKYYSNSAPAPDEFNLDFIGSGRIGDVRLRGATSFEMSPSSRFRSAELSAYWSASENVDWEGELAYDTFTSRGRARLTHVRRLDSMALALTGEIASDGSAAAGISLNFSLDPGRGFKPSRRPLAQAGIVRATVYRDLNDNGIREPSEPLEKGALVTTGMRLSEQATDDRGRVTIAGLASFEPIAVGVDESSLADPMLVPKQALQVVVPRPGVAAEVQIGLVGGGDIEGAIVKSGELGFEGLDLELLDASGKVVATARTDFDGFFLFQRVAYGSYRVRVASASAAAAKIAAELGVTATITPEKAISRLGAIHVVKNAELALAKPDVLAR